jgi:AcrR family transcriptional regulator
MAEPRLSEIKRRAAMLRIQQVALDLFDAHGYHAVTVEQVAAAAGVAPRSVYRYFGTKDGIVLTQPADDDAVAGLVSMVGDVDVLDAVRAIVPAFTSAEFADPTGYWSRLMHYVRTVPELSRAFASTALDAADRVAAAQASARGLPADDLATRVRARAVVVALMTAIDDWYARPGTDMAARVTAALDAVARIG